MVDLEGQHQKIRPEIDLAIQEVINNSAFINGNQVKEFSLNLASFLKVKHLIPCGNGTDALQACLMALDLKPQDEIIIPSFNYVSAAEASALLGLQVVFADCDPDTFTLCPEDTEKRITARTKVIIPVHLFGQCADMESLLALGKKYNLIILEDAAQALGATYAFKNGEIRYAGTIGEMGITSFFPSKNLGALGDGGAIFTNDGNLAEKIAMVCNHGQKNKYSFESIGINSRLDTLQAAVLNVKLKYFNRYIKNRVEAANFYDSLLKNTSVNIPKRINNGHTFNQYTIKSDNRELLVRNLKAASIPYMVYYPAPLHLQKAYQMYSVSFPLPVSEELASKVISLPMHTELDFEQQSFICENLLVGLT